MHYSSRTYETNQIKCDERIENRNLLNKIPTDLDQTNAKKILETGNYSTKL